MSSEPPKKNIIPWLVVVEPIVALVIAILAWWFPDPFRSPPLSPQAPQPSQPPFWGVIESSYLSFPWTKWLVYLVRNTPQETWPVVMATFSFLGFVLGASLLLMEHNRGKNSQNDVIFGIVSMVVFVLSFWYSISAWGWLGICTGYFVAFVCLLPFFYDHLYGAVVGGLVGGIWGTALSLAYLAIPGPFVEAYVFEGGWLGILIGAAIGAITIRGSLTSLKDHTR